MTVDPASYGQTPSPVYLDTLSRRARGELPEMESARRMAREVRHRFRTDDAILDVGCGCGHYLPSLERSLDGTFRYTGADQSGPYLDAARRIFTERKNVAFERVDIFALPFADAAFDIVMCNNLLLHLPSIETPLAELARVARRHLLVRTLIGSRGFRIQDLHEPEAYRADGTPAEFHFHNIYGEAYVRRIVSALPRVRRVEIERDRDFSAANIARSTGEHQGASNATTMLGEWQVNTYIMQPWAILSVDLA